MMTDIRIKFKKLIELLELLGFVDNSSYNDYAFIYSNMKKEYLYKLRYKLIDDELKFTITDTKMYKSILTLIVTEDTAIAYLKTFFKSELRKIKIKKLLL